MWILAVLLRPMRLILLGIVIAAVVLGLLYGPWLAAQGRTVATLATAYETPVLSWATQKLTDEPRLVNTTIAGTEVTIVNPAGEGPWHTVLLLNGATADGRFDSNVLQVASGLARVGHRVVIVNSPDPQSGDFTAASETEAKRVALALSRASQTRDGEVSIVGLGLGGTLALLAAEDPRLAPRVPLVFAASPLTDFVELGRVATTGFHRTADGFTRYPVPPELLRLTANVLLDALPAGPPRDLLANEINSALTASAEDDENNDPFAALDELPDGLLGPRVQAVVDLLANDDPEAYDALYAELPAAVRDAMERLSPVRGARRLQARVELATAPNDPLVPFAQAEALEQAAPKIRITVSEAFSSTAARPSLGEPGELLSLNALFVRSLYEIRNHE